MRLFEKIAQADMFVLFDAVQYERKGFQNRNFIKTNAGPLMLSVPVRHTENSRICDVLIDGQHGWARKHLRSIEMAYYKAPFYNWYIKDLREILSTNWTHLAALNWTLIEWILAQLHLKRKIEHASERDFQGAKSDLVLNMCKQLGATEYIFGQHGREYADVKAFEDAGIKVTFQDYAHPTYKQLHGAFVPDISVIDLLMNEGPRSLAILTGDG